MQHWKDTFLLASGTVEEAIRIINSHPAKICLVVDEHEVLLGTVTDGDIRRGLLSRMAITDPVTAIMNATPRTARPSDDANELGLALTNAQLRQMPLLDGHRRVVGLFTLDDWNSRRRPLDNWVVLMAGGLGTRLRPLTENTPKPLLKVGDRPLLETLVEMLTHNGFRRFYISVNYRADQVKQVMGDGQRFGAEIRYLEENERLGTAGALSLIPERPLEPILVMNGDVLTKINFRSLLDFHHEQKASATMCVREYEFQVPFGVVRTKDLRIIGIEEKPIKRFFVNAGIYVLEPEALDMIPKQSYFDMPKLFEALTESSRPAAAFPVHEYWMDIGRMDDLDRANYEFSEHFDGTP
jgi:dTDP-glucose pyrophosphorylase